MQKYKVFLKNQNIIFAFFDFRCIIPRKALFFWSFLVDRNDHFFFIADSKYPPNFAVSKDKIVL